MSEAVSTVEIDAEVSAALVRLSGVLHRPVQQLASEAVKAYLVRREIALAPISAADLSTLEAYRQSDPDFEHAIAAFVDAEATFADPIEGQRTVAKEGPVQAEIHKLLNG
ncbi:ribbon-helix-helix domain-containing protein [Flagellatimonas centrodinii]|uniref:ribbon-helix-helix domain-containing protein n=1 Tax=Flagellatimonas centrodinii TaxID=2806210 RepID=UPI001FEE7D27|nr:ribbon-helix-helix domain-containing protein [Flagellatimonas centrodinii]ULQ46912.1 ribbon-helix-helix domain-containing protein [Flagellatimonas centrodinii]